MPKINQSHEETYYDSQTGEVTKQITNQTYSFGEEPSFIKLYLNDLLYLADLPTRHTKILYELLKRSSYATPTEGMTVTVNSSIKKRIAEAVGIKSVGSIDNAITELVQGKILFRIDRGLYSFNPYLFGKGDWQNISRMRLTIDYDVIKGKTFSAVCAFEKQKNKTPSNDIEGQLSFGADTVA